MPAVRHTAHVGHMGEAGGLRARAARPRFVSAVNQTWWRGANLGSVDTPGESTSLAILYSPCPFVISAACDLARILAQ
jgi:hypothetical protein